MALIVFDLDGTLVDSRQDLAAAVNLMLRRYGAPPLPESEVTTMVGEGARVLVERALMSAGLPDRELPDALARFLDAYDEHLLDRTRPYPGIPELLERLHGCASLSVLTNKPTQASERVLEGLGLRRYFDEVIGGDSAYPRKPDPAALLHLIEGSGSDRENTLMIGDSSIDLATARNAGAACCLVRYGFGFPGEAAAAGALIADSPEALVEICARMVRTEARGERARIRADDRRGR